VYPPSGPKAVEEGAHQKKRRVTLSATAERVVCQAIQNQNVSALTSCELGDSCSSGCSASKREESTQTGRSRPVFALPSSTAGRSLPSTLSSPLVTLPTAKTTSRPLPTR